MAFRFVTEWRAADRAEFESCFTGIGAGPVAPGCERLDMEGDEDIDCDDWLPFAQAWTAADPSAGLEACVAVDVPVVSEWAMAVMSLVLLTVGTLAFRTNMAPVHLRTSILS